MSILSTVKLTGLLLCCLFVGLFNAARGQLISIPDQQFQLFLVYTQPFSNCMVLDQAGYNYLLDVSKASTITGTMNCQYWGIQNLHGIHAFTSLTTLNCSNNNNLYFGDRLPNSLCTLIANNIAQTCLPNIPTCPGFTSTIGTSVCNCGSFTANAGPDKAINANNFSGINPADLSTTGGTAPINYYWEGQTAFFRNVGGGYGYTFEPPTAGNYTFTMTATDKFGCRATDDLTFNVSSAPILSSISVDTAVAGSAMSVSVIGNTTTFTAANTVYLAQISGTIISDVLYEVTNLNILNDTELSFTVPCGVPTDKYFVLVDTTGLPGTSDYGNFPDPTIDTLFVKGGAASNLSLSGVLTTVCEGSQATIELNVTSGTPPFTLSLSDGTNTYGPFAGLNNGDPINFTPLILGASSVAAVNISDMNGCIEASQQGSVNITVNPTPVVTLTGVTTTVCAGDLATVQLNITTGTGPLTVNLSDGTNTYGPFAGLVNGDYINFTPLTTGFSTIKAVDFTDANVCSDAGPQGSVNITVNPTPVVTLTGITTTVCAGNQATVQLNVTTGTGPFTVSLSDGTNTYGPFAGLVNGDPINFTPLITGASTVVAVNITDANGCTDAGPQGSVNITVNPTPVVTLADVTTTVCAGDQATVQFNVTTGTGPFTVSLSDGVNTYGPFTGLINGDQINFTPLIAGASTFTAINITDFNGCTDAGPQGSVNIVNNQQSSYDLVGVTTNGCIGQSIQLQLKVLSGVTPLSFSISNGLGNTYGPFVGLINNSNLSFIANEPGAQTYSIIDLTDLNGCQNAGPIGSVSGNVYSVTPPNVTAPTVLDQGMAYEPVVNNPNANYTYSWDFDGDAQPDATGATPSFTYGAIGTYQAKLTTTTINGCVNTQTFNITIADPNASLSVTASAENPAINCGTATLITAFPNKTGVTFDWSPATGLSATNTTSVTASPQTTTAYTVTVTLGAATATAEVIVTVNPSPVTLASTNEICAGSSLTLNAGAGSGFVWTPNGETTQTISVSQAGTYGVTFTKANGCAAEGSIGITEKPAASAALSFSQPNICKNGTSVLTINFTGVGPTFDFQLDKGGQITNYFNKTSPFVLTVAALTPTTFSVKNLHDDGSNCTSTAVFDETLDIYPAPTATLSFSQSVVCKGESSTLTIDLAGVGSTFSFKLFGGVGIQTFNNVTSPFTLNVQPNSTATYLVSDLKDDQTTCLAQTNFSQTITVKPLPSATLTLAQQAIPFGGSTDLTVNFTGAGPTFDFELSDGANTQVYNDQTSPFTLTVSPSVPTVYTVKNIHDDGSDCYSTAQVSKTLSVAQRPVATLNLSADTICLGSNSLLQISIANSGPKYDFEIFNSVSTQTFLNQSSPFNLTVNPTATTVYTIQNLKDHATGLAAASNVSIQLTVMPKATATLSFDDPSVCIGGVSNLLIDISGSGGVYNFKLNDGGVIQTFTNQTSPVSLPITANVSKTVYVYDIFDQGANCQSSASYSAYLQTESPTASITGQSSVICPNAPLVLTVNLNGAGTFDFDFTDGVNTQHYSAQSGAVPITVNPSQMTLYKVINLKDNASGCVSQTYFGKTVSVGSNPTTATLTALSQQICAGTNGVLKVTFNGNGQDFSFDLFDGTTTQNYANQPNPAYISLPLTANTTFQVQNIVNNTTGCASSINSNSATITVTPNGITPPSLISGGTSVCAGAIETYTLSASYFQHNWTYSGGYILAGGGFNDNFIKIQWSSVSSNLYVKVIVSDANQCGSATLNTPIAVSATPSTPNLNAPSTFDINGGGTFSAASSVAAAYAWDFNNDGVTDATTQTANYVFPAPGIYTVKLTVANANGCTATNTKVVTVTASTQPLSVSAIVSGSGVINCGSSPATLTASASQPGAIYSWSPVAGLTSPNTAVTQASPLVTTTYTVMANANGELAFQTVTLTVNPTDFNVTGNQINGAYKVCSGGSLFLDAGPGTNFLWSPGGQTTQQAEIKQPGVYIVTKTKLNGCAAADTVNVLPYLPADAQLIVPDTIAVGVNTTVYINDVSWAKWMFGPDASPIVTNAYYITNVKYTTPGWKTIVVECYRPGCGYFVKTKNVFVTPSENLITGYAYYDVDSIGIFSANDIPIAGKIIQWGFQKYATTDANGYYEIEVGKGSVYISTTQPVHSVPVQPASMSYSYNFPTFGMVKNNQNFGFKQSQVHDLRIQIFSDVQFSNVRDQNVWLYVTNKGAEIENPVVTFYYDSRMKYVAPNSSYYPTPLSVDTVNHSITVQLPPVLPGQNGLGVYVFRIPVTTMPGLTLNGNAKVEPIVGDAIPADNYTNFAVKTSGSFDPNQKLVFNTKFEAADYASNNDTLVYQIEFQNTGTDTAYNVFVVDTLPENVVVESFEFLGSSHKSEWRIMGKGVLWVYFPNINLVDSTKNEPESHGILRFRIRLKDSLACDTKVNNRCGIYFDFNEPVITNYAKTVVNPTPTGLILSGGQIYKGQPHTFMADVDVFTENVVWDFGANAMPATATGIGPHSVTYSKAGLATVKLTVSNNECSSEQTENYGVAALSGSADNLSASLSIFPNPTNGLLNVEAEFGQTREVKIELTDLTGRVIYESVENTDRLTKQLDLASFSRGLYLLKLTAEGQTVIRKITLQ